MAIHVTNDQRFGGLPLVRVRDLLVALTEPYFDEDIAQLDGIDLPSPVVTAFRCEFRRRGAFGPLPEGIDPLAVLPAIADDWVSFSRLSDRPRAPRRQAEAVLEDVLARYAAYNADPWRFVDIREVWLFGSMLGDSPDVGDIDVVVIDASNVENITRYESLSHKARLALVRETLSDSEIEAANGDRRAIFDLFGERRLYGEGRHHLLADNSLEVLVDMHVPCRLVFSQDRGGRVDDPVLPHHPHSRMRADRIAVKGIMPDLAAKSLPAPIDLDSFGGTFPSRSSRSRGRRGAPRLIGARIGALRMSAEGEDVRLSGPAIAALDPPSRDDDLAVFPVDPSLPVAGVLRFAHRWVREGDLAISDFDIELVGNAHPIDEVLSCAAGYVAYLASVSMHLAKLFTTAARVEIRLKAMDDRVLPAIETAIESFVIDPRLALEGGARRGGYAPGSERDPAPLFDVSVVGVAPDGTTRSVDLGTAFELRFPEKEDAEVEQAPRPGP